MQRHARATANDEHPDRSAPQRREALVTGLAVAAVAIAAVLAAVMHTRQGARGGAPWLALGAGGDVIRTSQAEAPGDLAAGCVECGVVEAVVPLGMPAAEAGAAWQVRIRMDDGSVRLVEQRGAPAKGSRVTIAGGAVRVLSNRPGQG